MKDILRIFVALIAVASSDAVAFGSEFRIGAAKEDITGEVAEVGMIGYGTFQQISEGIQTPLYSRAFVIESVSGNRRIAIVTADLAMMTHAVKDAVIDKLNEASPGVYTFNNVMLTATHTHSGAGGYSPFALFNISTFGFQKRTLAAITQGIVKSILNAQARLTPGRIFFSQGRLEGISVNRSLPGSLAKRDRGSTGDTTNKIMTVLKFQADDGRDLGLLSWFSVHATSMSRHNRLISSDSKGYAAWVAEKSMGGSFVAAFANGDEGDVSPNLYDSNWNRLYDDLESIRVIGVPQANAALDLYETSNQLIGPDLDYRHLWVKMPGFRVGNRTLCASALGYSFAAGAEDGPSGLPGFREGLRQQDVEALKSPYWFAIDVLRRLVFSVDAEIDRCQYPKPVLISAGKLRPSWTPETLPFQLFRIGSLAIVAVPAELTTMAGRQLRAAVLEKLEEIGVENVVIAGLANEYSGYVTTNDEYEAQNYEGAFTLFGSATFAAYQQIFSSLADSLRRGVQLPPGELPEKPAIHFGRAPGEGFDSVPLGESFGDPLQPPKRKYETGDWAEARFRSTHPNHRPFRPNSDIKPFAEIQRFTGDNWVTFETESNPDVFFIWNRDHWASQGSEPFCSVATIKWHIPKETEPGKYRILYRGWIKRSPQDVEEFTGTSRSFKVE